jgi:hypothetical protein
MQVFNARTIGLIGLCAIALMACNTATVTPLGERPVLIPETTKTLDAPARSALKRVQPDGTLRFAAGSAAPSLKAGDVLVSDVSTATPNGLLRKVKAVRQEGGELIVETQEAKLVDAIHSGHAKIQQKLEFGKAVEIKAFGRVRAQEKRLEVDTDFGTNGVIHASGPIVIDPILDIDMDISCNTTVAGHCAEIPDLNMSASIGLNEVMNLKFTGKTTPGFDKEVQLASYAFPPISFSIGPVPIVIIPKLVLYLRSNGKISARFETRTNQNLNLVVGFKFNSDTGFSDTSQRGGDFDTEQPSVDGTAEIKTSLGVRFELLFWGVLGPYGSLEAGPRLEASSVGVGPEKRLWKLEKCVDLNIGVRIDILIYTKAWEKQVYSACDFIRQQNNHAPIVSIQQPTAVTQIFANVATTLRPDVFDEDGGLQTCQWSSSVSSDVMPSNGCEQSSYTFTTTGKRTLSVTATDSAGATSSSSVDVTVQVTPKILVNITSPAASEPNLNPFSPSPLEASASGGDGPYTYTWSIVYPTDAQGVKLPPVVNPGTARVTPALVDLDSIAISTGNPLQWTPASVLSIPDKNPCENVDKYGRLMVKVTDKNGVTGQSLLIIRMTRVC